jgi:hypothetical protein
MVSCSSFGPTARRWCSSPLDKAIETGPKTGLIFHYRFGVKWQYDPPFQNTFKIMYNPANQVAR